MEGGIRYGDAGPIFTSRTCTTAAHVSGVAFTAVAALEFINPVSDLVTFSREKDRPSLDLQRDPGLAL
jgi:hypothetical protein